MLSWFERVRAVSPRLMGRVAQSTPNCVWMREAMLVSGELVLGRAKLACQRRGNGMVCRGKYRILMLTT